MPTRLRVPTVTTAVANTNALRAATDGDGLPVGAMDSSEAKGATLRCESSETHGRLTLGEP